MDRPLAAVDVPSPVLDALRAGRRRYYLTWAPRVVFGPGAGIFLGAWLIEGLRLELVATGIAMMVGMFAVALWWMPRMLRPRVEALRVSAPDAASILVARRGSGTLLVPVAGGLLLRQKGAAQPVWFQDHSHGCYMVAADSARLRLRTEIARHGGGASPGS